MQPILRLTQKDFFTGLSPYLNITNQGLFSSASGLNPFITPGVLKTQGDVTDLTASVVVDIPFAGVSDTTNLFILGNAGHFYKIANVNTAPVVTDLRSGTPITNPVAGMAIFQPQGAATKYLYYWMQTKIGRWDLAGTYATGWDDNYVGAGGTINVALQTTPFHPVHKMFDEIYYGNLDRIGQIKDDGAAGITHSASVLNFPTESTVTALSDDGTYLVAAVTKSTGSTSLYQSSKIIFWDKYSSSWNREWAINDPVISALKEKNGIIYAWGARGLWAFNFMSGPVLLRPDITAAYGYPQQMGQYNDALVLGTYTYGKAIPGVPNALFQPYGSQMTGGVSLVMTGASSLFTIFGTASSKLYQFGTASSGTTPRAMNTIYMPLGGRYEIKAMKVVLRDPMTAGDVYYHRIAVSASISDTSFTTMSYAIQGGKQEAMLYPQPASGPNLVGEYIQLELNANTGSGPTLIKEIVIYGIPADLK